MNLMEAFTALDKLNEDVFTVDAEGIKKLQDFVQNDDTVDELDVFNLDAEPDEDVDENECHIGDAILDCCVCHSKVFKPVAEIIVDEESQVANKGEECPYCYSVEGYKVVGEVNPLENNDESDYDDLEEGLFNRKKKPSVKSPTKFSNKWVVKDGWDKDLIVSEHDTKDEAEKSAASRGNDGRYKVQQIKVTESTEYKGIIEESKRGKWRKNSIKEAIDLSTKENTIASLLKDNMSELASIIDVNELRERIIELVDNSDIAGKPVAQKLKRDLYSKKSAGALLSTIATYMTGDKVIKTGRYKKAANESCKRKSIKESMEIPAPYNKYFTIDYEDNNDDELVGKKVGGVHIVAPLKPIDEDKVDIFPYLTSDKDFPVVEIVRDRAYPVDLSDYGLSESCKRKSIKTRNKRKSIKESDSDEEFITWYDEESDDELDTFSLELDKILSSKGSVDYDFATQGPRGVMTIIFNGNRKDFDYTKILKSIYNNGAKSTAKIYANKVLSKSIKESDSDEETIGDKLKKYQMWVDYDMKHYGKVSKTTQDIIDKEGLQLIKDQYGDYEVSVGRYKAESVVTKPAKKQCKHRLKEDINSIVIDSDDLSVEIDKSCDRCNKEQVIVPASEETKEEIETENIDRDTIEDAVEECLTESFSNVKFFKCSNLTSRKNRIIVEGILGFKSGRKKNTSFVFRPSLLKESKIVFRGFNRDLKESVKSISLNCKKQGNKIIVESYKVSK